MNLADELRKLQELHQSGALTDKEFAAAKARILNGENTRALQGSPFEQERLDSLERQNQLLQLDNNWQREREQYMIRGKYGHRYVPNKAWSVIGGGVAVVFGLFWTGMAFSITSGFPGGIGSLFPLFGVVFIVVGIAGSIYSFSRAEQYERAQRRYHQRRSQILGEDANSWLRNHDDPR